MNNMTEYQAYFSGLPLDGGLLFDEPMSKHTTFRIGGNAEILFLPSSVQALTDAVRAAKSNNIPFRVIGNGSNILVADEGLNGLTIKICGCMDGISDLGGGIVECGAGLKLIRLCEYALDNSLSGMEFAYGIPGTVGGALFMNAGAYGGEIKDVLVSVRCFDAETGETEDIPIERMNYSYRDTPFMKSAKIIISGRFRLKSGDKGEIEAKMKELLGKRRDKQPLDMPSAGSTFKRPEGHFAGRLIEDAGLKGSSCGGAEVSTKHAGFVVNKGGATCEDVLCLIRHIQKTVLGTSGVKLEPEVIYLKKD